jgi:hypothetical protein
MQFVRVQEVRRTELKMLLWMLRLVSVLEARKIESLIGRGLEEEVRVTEE